MRQKVGFATGKPASAKRCPRLQEDTVQTEGMVSRIMGYRLQLEGNVQLEKAGNRIQFESAWTLTTNPSWRILISSLKLARLFWNSTASAAIKGSIQCRRRGGRTQNLSE